MKKKIHLFLLVCAICIANLLAGCDLDENFSTDRSNWLTFSTDTVSFDTVVSGVVSSTRQFKIYNRNKNGLRITSARLGGGSSSMYRVNIDGVSLGVSNDFTSHHLELRGGDSLFVFIDINPIEQDQDALRKSLDELVFTLESGLVQTLKLQAHVQDVYRFRAHTFTTDTTLTKGRPFLIFDSLSVAQDAILWLDEGVQLYFHDKANLVVRGKLLASGTHENPVIFRGDRTDRMFAHLPYDNTPGRWGGIKILSESTGNYLNYCDIHSASFGVTCSSSPLEKEKIRIENSIIHNIEGTALSFVACSTFVGNTQISNTLGNCVELIGGVHEFVHCTLAQFYPWSANRAHALAISNSDEATSSQPFGRAWFKNCLITGYANNEIYSYMRENSSSVFDFMFYNCLINTVKSDDNALHVINSRYDETSNQVSKEGNFKRFDTRNFLYNFSLVEKSIAIDAGSVEWSMHYPMDRNGVSRMVDNAPDAGCYEFVNDAK